MAGEPVPPGVLLRAAAGAWHLLVGLAELRRPALWPASLLPATVALGGVTGGAFMAVLASPRLLGWLAPSSRRLPEWLELSLLLGLAAGVMLAGMLLGLTLSLVVSTPGLERLADRLDEGEPGHVPRTRRPLGWTTGESLRSNLSFLSRMCLVPLLALLPVVGPALAATVGALVLGDGLIDPPLIRRGLGKERGAFRRRFRPEAMGLGAAAVLTLCVPVVNLLLAGPLAPALCLGAARLVSALQALDAAATKEEGPEAPASPRPRSVDETR
jgi:uncharacterized protein involved in cysteine biosynthesis